MYWQARPTRRLMGRESTGKKKGGEENDVLNRERDPLSSLAKASASNPEGEGGKSNQERKGGGPVLPERSLTIRVFPRKGKTESCSPENGLKA